MKIEVEYDGEYPNLCSGHLKLKVDGKMFDFGQYCLSSGGYIDPSGDDYSICTGEWTVREDAWPHDFPEDLKDYAVFRINQEIPHSCCGGCI